MQMENCSRGGLSTFASKVAATRLGRLCKQNRVCLRVCVCVRVVRCLLGKAVLSSGSPRQYGAPVMQTSGDADAARERLAQEIRRACCR